MWYSVNATAYHFSQYENVTKHFKGKEYQKISKIASFKTIYNDRNRSSMEKEESIHSIRALYEICNNIVPISKHAAMIVMQ